jgi:response regulator RpfG family c-di-GMP phosphodiesterase
MDWLKNEDNTQEIEEHKGDAWNILIVDDDEQVHLITRQVLKRFTFENRPMEFFSAFSADQAKDFLERCDKKIALILLDVVMEENDSGLKLARVIRQEMKNHYTRIILRTGQPGAAPEYDILKEYDIDAYKNKTELRKADLESAFYTALRSYRDLVALQSQRNYIEQVVSSINKINSAVDLSEFASSILTQISHLVGGENSELLLDPQEAYAVSRSPSKTKVLALSGEGEFTLDLEHSLDQLRKEVRDAIDIGFNAHREMYIHPYYVHYLLTQRKNEIILTFRSNKDLSSDDQKLLKLFSANISLTYENLILNEEIMETQNLLIRILGGAMESRSRETGSHVKRVGEISATLAEFCGTDMDYVQRIRVASPLHDVGKVSTPDSILNKADSLNKEEWEVMKRHTLEGYEILKETKNPIIDMASKIALEHHEHWDGQGYPNGKSAHNISMEGRIVALADVYDALRSERIYKKAWSNQEAIKYIEENRGKHFDPQLVDLFLLNIERFLNIYREYPD